MTQTYFAEDTPSPTTFAERIAAAKDHEAMATDVLRAADWLVCDFGQAMLSKEVRDALRRTDSDLRWLPDKLATRAGHECLIDAKAGLSETANHAIELRAHRAHLNLTLIYGTPVAYMFDDGTVKQAVDIVIETMMPGSHTRGSGTPFLLTRKSTQVPFDELFGAVLPGTWDRDWRSDAQAALAVFNQGVVTRFGWPLAPEFWRGKA